MITPFNLYMIMQLDNIRCAMIIPIVILILLTVAGFIMMMSNIIDSDIPEKQFSDPWHILGKKIFRRAGLGSAFVLALLAFLPSSRSAAVIVVLPAIVNNEAIQKEAADLYQLAKDGLRRLVEDHDDDRHSTNDPAK
jgi:hypothetical protein